MQLVYLDLEEMKALFQLALYFLLGITIGVATLIIVMSVMNGFRAQLIEQNCRYNFHLILYFNDESYKNQM